MNLKNLCKSSYNPIFEFPQKIKEIFYYEEK